MIFSAEKGNVFLVLAIVDTVRVIMAIITQLEHQAALGY